MDLNDPFNRLSKQNQSEYLTFRDSLKKSDVDSQTKAEALMINIQKRAWIMGLLTLMVSALIILFFSDLKVVVMVFAALFILWLLTTTFKGRRLIRRYIQDEFSSQ